MTSFQKRDLGLLSVLLLLTLVPRIYFLIRHGIDIFNADNAVFGLMAQHALQGQFTVYYYGQGYMGAIEAYIAALIFSLAGPGVFQLLCAPLVFFCAFMVVTYLLFLRLCGRLAAFFAGLVLACGSAHLTILSLTALGGYPETLFFAVLTAFLLTDPRHRQSFLFAGGAAAGLGLWTNPLIVIFLITWIVWRAAEAGLFRWQIFFDFILVRHPRIPFWIRIPILILHGYWLWYAMTNFFGMATGFHGEWGSVDVPSPPFQVKKIKKIVLLLALECVGWSVLTYGIRNLGQALLKKGVIGLGFILGYAPALLFSLFGGEGYRVLHSSGIVYLKDWPGQIQYVGGLGLARGIWGVPIAWINSPDLFQKSAAVFFILFCAAMLFLALRFFIKRKTSFHVMMGYSVFLLFVTIAVCFFSTLQADRYLLPCYLGWAVLLGCYWADLWPRRKVLVLIVVFLWLGQSIVSHAELSAGFPSKQKNYEALRKTILFLEEEGIRGAYADYWKSYPLTFLSREKLIAAPYQSPDRYPRYTKFVDSLKRVAFVFEETDPQFPGIESFLASQGWAVEKKQIDLVWVYIVNR